MNKKGFKGYNPTGNKTKEQRGKEKDFLKRRDAMLKEVEAASLKYKIDIVGAIEYRRDGVWPLVAFTDVKDKYEEKVEDKKIKPTLET